MTDYYCGRCGRRVVLKQGFYSIYYRCEQCTNRFTVHDAEALDQLPEGRFETARLIGEVLPEKSGRKIIVVRRKKHADDIPCV